MEGWHLILTYLLIGFCTQLPGVIYGHFLQLPFFCHLQYSCFLTKFIVGIFWLIFTSVLWSIPFLFSGLNYIALELVAVGVLSAYIIVNWASTPLTATLTVVVAGVVAIFLARPGKRWPTII